MEKSNCVGFTLSSSVLSRCPEPLTFLWVRDGGTKNHRAAGASSNFNQAFLGSAGGVTGALSWRGARPLPD